jgi:hypothetical protein
MKLLLKEFVLFRGLISGVRNWFIRRFSAINVCQGNVSSEVECGFLPLEVLAQIDYDTMLQMINVSDGRRC